MIDEWICNSNGFILVFALDDNDSYENIQNLVEKIKKNNALELPKMLVGNKYDLQNERKIPKQKAQDYAKSIGAKYFETSALKDENGNCKTVFQECANMIIDNANKEEGRDSKCARCSIF